MCHARKLLLIRRGNDLYSSFSPHTFGLCRHSREILWKKIIIELQFERMLTQILITVGTFTDFTNPVHTTDRFKVNSYHERRHLRTENYTVSLTVAYKFILALIPHLHSRTLNVITVSPDAASNLIHSFETPGDPSGSYRRVLLANI